jgi:hypothetical protein
VIKKLRPSSLLIIVLFASFLLIPKKALAYSGQGSGTAGDPYLIANCVQLQEMQDNLSASYKLANDMDCNDNDLASWNGFKGFDPIGDDVTPFTGSFDGDGHTILHLTIIRADDTVGQGEEDEEYVGLFGRTQSATIKNLNIGSSKIKGYRYVGGIIGYMQGGTLTNSSVNRDVPDNSCTVEDGACVWARYGEYGGGLVGLQNGGTISYSSTDGPVKGSGNIIGGLVGQMDGNAQLLSSYAQGNIDGGNDIGGAVGYAAGGSSISLVHAIGNVDANSNDDFKQGQYGGGLVGYLSYSTISRSYATGAVHADQYNVGGLVGEVTGGNVYDSYATGDVASDHTYAGGLIGTVYDNADIQRTYATGNVSATGSTAGGFTSETIASGDSKITIKDSFALGEITSAASSGAFIANPGPGTELVNNFFDKTRAGITYNTCTGYGGSVEGCTPINENGMDSDHYVDTTTAAPLDNWDFTNIWTKQNSAYPVLDDGTDTDNDGVSNKLEESGPNNGDANNDGVQDANQANVASFINTLTNDYMVVETDCDQLVNIQLGAEAASPADASYDYPMGLTSFRVNCSDAGGTTRIRQYYYGVTGSDKYTVRKWMNDGSYMQIPGSKPLGTLIDGDVVFLVEYNLTDGSIMDDDGEANGVIVDPSGPALSVTNATTSAESTLAATGQSATALIMLSICLTVTGLALVKNLETPKV